MVEEDNTPLSVTVTPCDAPLEWQLSLQELPEEASGESSGKQHRSRPASAGRARRLVTHAASAGQEDQQDAHVIHAG